ncbi:Ig-like domain-containing protein, partial [Campylobacter concisus]
INPIDNDDTTVSGKVPNAEPNTTVTVKFPDGSTATTTVDNNGNWTVPTPGNNPLTPGSTVTATAEDNGGSSNPVNSNPTTDV